MMKKQTTHEKKYDKLLEHAAARQLDRIADQAHHEAASTKHKFSNSFENKMQALFSRQHEASKRAKYKKSAVQAAVAISVVVILSTVSILSVEAWRTSVLRFISEVGERSTTFRLEGEKVDYSQLLIEPAELYLPTYMPAGYTFEHIEKAGDFYVATYENDAGDTIILQNLTDGTTVGIDSEDAEHEQLLLNDEEAHYYYKDGYSTLLFGYDENAFLISGLVSREEIVRIAESMEYIE